jgi:hypothetical protein
MTADKIDFIMARALRERRYSKCQRSRRALFQRNYNQKV